MTIILDNRKEIAGPGLHALVVGVSEYAHLPRHDDPPSEATWMLRSLGSGAISAAHVANWLKEAVGLSRPLKTLRVLLSPTAIERDKLPEWAINCGSPIRDNFAQEAQQWRIDCTDDRNSVAFFYYIGHGFARGRGEYNVLLAMEDLFDTPDVLQKTTLASNLFNGMAPQSENDSVAREQFFFFDCCRTFPSEIREFDDLSVPTALMVRIAEGVPDDRLYLRCFAVPDNDSAFARVGEDSYFATGLIDSLNRSGISVDGTAWKLDGESISQRLRARYQLAAERAVVSEVVGGGPTLKILAQPPTVDVEVGLEPTVDATNHAIALNHAVLGRKIGDQIALGKYKIDVSPGEYELNIRFGAEDWHATNDPHDRKLILPNFANPWISMGWK
ncbi:caspase family protein [Caballeronia sp. GAOx1]|uniref:caspase family protein n=1 Tax=Caballeronia sp. GAOx1 TaxID=2921761 RepID=UPI00202821C5|nr:caspase family protein [Caballeronia sp. GAOx1]